MLTEAYLEPSSTSTMELFSLQLNHILKAYLIELPLSTIFYATRPFVKKTYNSENFRRKSLLLTMEHFFSRNLKLRTRMASSINRSSHQKCSLRKGVLSNFAKFTRKHLYQSLFIFFIKKQALAQVFSCKFWAISQNTFFTEHPWPTASEERFFKLAPNKSLKTACVCIAFFFHYFKHYGQNIFSRITVLYLIAKVEIKEKTFYLKHEIALFQKKREAKCFRLRRRVKTSEKRLFHHLCFFLICGSLLSFV